MGSIEENSIAGDDVIGKELFGGNLLAPRRPLLGEEGYEGVIEDLQVHGLRFPGGSLTEEYFDLANPDQTVMIDSSSGREFDMISLSDFLDYSETAGQPVTIVVPTRTQLSNEVDENGDRLTEIDEDVLRTFVSDVANGVYGGAEIASFEIGNEYWGSGEMNAAEYGRLAAEMAVIINEEVENSTNPDIGIAVQKGNNFHYSRLNEEYEGFTSEEAIADLNEKYDLGLDDSAIFNSGNVNWAFVNAHLVMSGFDTEEKAEAIDSVVAHIYSRGEISTSTRHFDLDQINATWVEEFPGIEILVTEWNLKSSPGLLDRDEDYGLFQAQEMLEIMEEFIGAGVDEAFVWPLIQITRNSLSEGMEHEELTAPGEMFALMSETLPGKVLIDFASNERDTELEIDTISMHAFAGEGELALYLVNESHENGATVEVDLQGLIHSFEDMDAIVLGVEDGASPGSNASTAVIEDVDFPEAHEGSMEVSLSPGEIMQVVFSGVTPAAGFEETWTAANSADPFAYMEQQEEEDASVDVVAEPAFDFPTVDVPEGEMPGNFEDEEEADPFADDGFDDDGFDIGLGLLLLLGLAGAGFGLGM